MVGINLPTSHSDYRKEYHKANKEELLLKDKKRREENKDILSEKKRKYYLKNKDRIKKNSAKWAKENPGKRKEIANKWTANNKDKVHFYANKYKHKNPEKKMLYSAKKRASRNNMDFNITIEDIVVPDFCPLLGIMISTYHDDMGNHPSLDRIDNRYGYIKGNVLVVSHRANMLKNNATAEELLTIAINLIDITESM